MSTSDNTGPQQPSTSQQSQQSQHHPNMEYRDTRQDADPDESDANIMGNPTFDEFARGAAATASLTSGPQPVPNRTNVLRPSVLNNVQNQNTNRTEGNPGIRLQAMDANVPHPFNQGPPPDENYDDDLNDVIDKLRYLNTDTTSTGTPLPPIPQKKSLEPVYLTPLNSS